MERCRHTTERAASPQEVEQGAQLESRRDDAEYQRRAQIAPGLPLVFLDRSGRAIRAAIATAGVFLVASSAVATVAAGRAARTPARLADAAALGALPADAVVTVSTADPWRQAWELYDLRNLRVSVERPTFLLTKQGVERRVVYRHRPVSYAVVYTEAGAATVVPAGRQATAAKLGRPRSDLGPSSVAARLGVAPAAEAP